jgi:putative tryptophan/tyrosine transport system substrate-binding protein
MRSRSEEKIDETARIHHARWRRGCDMAACSACAAAGRTRLIGVLMPYAEDDTYAQSLVAAFRAALAKLGWIGGSNLQIELRWGAGDEDRFKSFAKELVDLRPDALLGVSTLATGALAKQTQTIPIVFAIVGDPIRSGFAVSLPRPGRNITGFTEVDSTLGGKWVGLLKEIAPSTARVALLFNPTTAPPLQIYLSSIQAAASFPRRGEYRASSRQG